MSPIDKLIEIFSNFPGIGPKQSKRFVYFLLSQNGSFLKEFSGLLLSLKENISVCESCFRFFPTEKKDFEMCKICRSPNRDKSKLLIVSRDTDLDILEKSGAYDGMYFVLGGSVPILSKDPEKRVRGKDLVRILEKNSKEIKEIILAMNLNPEGEHTQEYIVKLIKPFTDKNNIKISFLGRGLSTGTELEYSDRDTLKNALERRV